MAAAVVDDGEEEPAVYQQPQRQSQRVSVRQVMAGPHRYRSPQQQQQQPVDQPRAQYSNKNVRAVPAANRRPMRPVYEYADEYYDE
jgi:hypothetical protein